MGLLVLLLALAGIAAWIGSRRDLDRRSARSIALILGFAAAALAAKGQFPAAAASAAIAVWLALRAPRVDPAALPSLPIREACELLGLSADADEAAIRAAHRRLIARVHPDTGGSAELTRRVNDARDTLLEDLSRRR